MRQMPAQRTDEDCTVREDSDAPPILHGSARIIIIVVTWLLAIRGLKWVAFTGAASLINSFQRLGLQPSVLAVADPERLDGEQDQWGTYYAQRPQVFAGNIGYGFEALTQAGVFQRLGLPALSQGTGHAA